MSTEGLDRLLTDMEEGGEFPAPGSEEETLLNRFIMGYAADRATNGVFTVIHDGSNAATILLHPKETKKRKKA